MKKTKKLLGILLAVCLVVSTVSVSFTSFAAVTDAQWNTLIDALTALDPSKETYTVNTSSKTTEFKNASAELLAVADAYMAVYNGYVVTNPGTSSRAAAPRVTNAINAEIKTQLNSKMSGAFTNELTGIINAFAAGVTVDDNEISGNSKKTAVSITVKVTLDDSATLAGYDTLEALMAAGDIANGYTYTFPNNDATYSVSTTECGRTTTVNYHYLLAATATKGDSGSKVDKTAIQALYEDATTYADYFDDTIADFVALDADVRNAALTKLDADFKAVSAYAAAKYFSEYPFTAVINGLTDANTIAEFIPLVEDIKELYATDYSAYELADLQDFYETYNTLYTQFTGCTAQVKDFFSDDTFNVTALAAKDAEINKALQLYELRVLKNDTVDPAYAAYVQYDEDDFFAGDIATDDIILAKGEIAGYLTALATYDEANVLEVFGAQAIADLEALSGTLDYLIDVADADAAFAAKYATYISTVYAAVDYAADSAEIVAGVKAYDGWYTELKTFCDGLVTEFGQATADKIFTTLLAEMQEQLDAKYDILNTRVTTEIDTAFELLEEVKTIYGGEVTILSVETYGYLKDAIGFVEGDIADFLQASPNYAYDETMVAKYNELRAVVFDDYEEFLETGGYDQYITSTYDDIVRTVADGEKIRNADYTVDDELANKIIDILDKALNSDQIKALLAGEDGEPATIGDKLHEALAGVIYTDDLLNTIAGALYKLVAEELQKVWSGAVKDEMDVDVGVNLHADLRGLDPLHSIANKLGLQLFPKHLANNVAAAGYTEAAAKLAAAVSESVYTPEDKANGIEESVVTAWSDEVLLDEEGNLDLYWGITDRDSFVEAAKAALSGLEPLLRALLANKPFDSGMVQNLGDFKGSAKVLITININAKVQMDLTAEGCTGYNDVIVPLLEALGVPAEFIPDGNQFTSTEDILVKGLIEPVSKVLDMVGEAPVDFVTKALPNIAYGLQAGRIIPALSKLKTNISFVGGLYDYGAIGAIAGLLAGDLGTILTPEMVGMDPDDLAINVGEMIDFDDLGIDISSLNGLLGMVGGLLGEGIVLPKIDGGKLASLGTLTQIPTERNHKTYSWGDDGYAAYIEANRADVLLFLFDYVINALKANPTLIEDIVASVQASKAEEAIAEEGEEAPAEAEPFVLPDAVKTILDNVIAGYDTAENKFDALAALAELVQPVEYTTEARKLTYEPIDTTEFAAESVVYENEQWWDADKAAYVSENLTSFIDNLIMILGIKVGDVKVESLAETVDNLFNSFYKAETVNNLAATLAGLFDGLELDDAMKDLIVELINVNLGDITVWNDYNADFEDGDKEAFKAALTELLAPAQKLLEFILCDEDLTLSLTDDNGEITVVTAAGHMGYTYGIIPLLEALGAENVLSTDEFVADKDNLLANILDPLMSVLDKIAEDPYTAVEELLPNLLYFLQQDGLAVAIDNLLYPVDQLLEVIAPVYKISIDELVDFDIRFATIDPVEFIFSLLEDVVYEATGIEFEFDFSATELLNTLTCGEVEEYTSQTGETSYRIAAGDVDADMITTLLRFILSETLFSDNAGKLVDYLKGQFDLPEEIWLPLYAFLVGMQYMEDTHVDYALGILFYIFYGANTAVEAVADYYQYMRYDWQEMAAQLTDDSTTPLQKATYLFEQVYEKTGMTIMDTLYEEGHSPLSGSMLNELIKTVKNLFTAIIDLFKAIGTKLGI